VTGTALGSAVRRIRKESDCYLERARRLTGPGVPVGGAHIDEYARGEGLAKFLCALGRGRDPEGAAEEGKAEAALWLRNWNQSRRHDYVVHRWEQGADAVIEDAWREVVRAITEDAGGAP
jgi:hypothetical protein